MTENKLSKIVVDCYYKVHKTFGRLGLLESVYEEILMYEFLKKKNCLLKDNKDLR